MDDASDGSSNASFTTVAPAVCEASPHTFKIASVAGLELKSLLAARLKGRTPLAQLPVSQSTAASSICDFTGSSISDYPESSAVISPDDSVSRIGVQSRAMARLDGDERFALSRLSAQQVAQLMHAIDLGRYADRILALPLRGADLEEADDSDLVEAGIDARVHRRVLLRQVAEWRNEGVPGQYLRGAASLDCLEMDPSDLHHHPLPPILDVTTSTHSLSSLRSTLVSGSALSGSEQGPLSNVSTPDIQTPHLLPLALNPVSQTNVLLREAERMRAIRRTEAAAAQQAAELEAKRWSEAEAAARRLRLLQEWHAAVRLQALARRFLVCCTRRNQVIASESHANREGAASEGKGDTVTVPATWATAVGCVAVARVRKAATHGRLWTLPFLIAILCSAVLVAGGIRASAGNPSAKEAEMAELQPVATPDESMGHLGSVRHAASENPTRHTRRLRVSLFLRAKLSLLRTKTCPLGARLGKWLRAAGHVMLARHGSVVVLA
jgi:hypothetical protein